MTHRPPSGALIAVGTVALSLGILAFLLDVAGWIRMPFTLTFVSLPGLLVVVVLAVYTRRADETLVWSRLKHGLAAGLAGTVVYDALRGAVQLSGLFSYNAFRAIPLFGSLITGLEPASVPAALAGWAYHFWNGISFAMMYALNAAGRPCLWGLAWAMFLEAAMVLTYPVAFGVPRSDAGFLSISFIGHAAYGIVLGLWIQRLGRPSRQPVGVLA